MHKRSKAEKIEYDSPFEDAKTIVQVKNSKFYPQRNESMWDNHYLISDKVWRFYHGPNEKKNLALKKKHRRWKNSAGKSLRDKTKQ